MPNQDLKTAGDLVDVEVLRAEARNVHMSSDRYCWLLYSRMKHGSYGLLQQ